MEHNDADQTSQFIKDWDAREASLISCAQRAWASLGKGYELAGFYIQDSNAIVGIGYPPRAKHEYHHAFLFEQRNWEGKVHEHLRAVGKAPWHRTLEWWGTGFVTNRALVATFELGEFCVRKAYANTF